MNELKPNEKKNLVIQTTYGAYNRYPVKTHVVMDGDDLCEIMGSYVMQHIQPGDVILISEKIVAISQGRAFPITEIKPSRLANFLYKFVYNSPYGIGLRSPWTMELAVREIGGPKICAAALISAAAKLFGKRGVFYNMLGPAVRAIDGPCDCTLPPYNGYAKLAPKDPDLVARQLADWTGCQVAVIDANDLGVEILGKSGNMLSTDMLKSVLRDNPLGQSREQTPVAILRRVRDEIIDEPVYDEVIFGREIA